MEIVTPIIVAVITGTFALAGTIISNSINHGKTLYRIEQLESKVDKHNHLVERMYNCESAIDLLNERQKNLTNEVAELKRGCANGK